MERPATVEERQWSRNWQLYSLLVGPIAYSIFFVAGYLLVETACETGILLRRLAGIPLVLLLVVALSVVTLGLIAYGGIHAYRAWGARRDQDLLAEERDQFMALSALILTTLFGLGTVLTALSVVVLEPCRWM